MFNSIIGSTLTIESLIICLIVSLALGLVVAALHMLTGRYTKNFAITLATLPVLVTSVIMMVNGNLGTSIAVVGAFSLIRFRSIPGTSREILNVFFAMAIGLAVGTGYIAFAACITLFVAIITLILYKTKIGSNGEEKVFKVLISEDLDYESVFDDTFNKYLKKYELVSTKTLNMGSLFELTYKINLKENKKEKEFINDIRILNGNLKVSLSKPLEGDNL